MVTVIVKLKINVNKNEVKNHTIKNINLKIFIKNKNKVTDRGLGANMLKSCALFARA